MALVSSSIPNLANGVSQQSASLRLNSQGEEQVNAFSSIISGLRKRPPTEYLATLLTNAVVNGNYFIHIINRDITERYIVIANNTSLRVFDFNGVEKTVTTPSGYGYLATGNAMSDFKAVTVADYTFILNKSVATAVTASTSTPAWPEAIVHCKQGNYATDYKIYLDDVQRASYTTADDVKAQLKTNNIANQLATQLVANLGSVYTVTWDGSAIRIQRTDGNDFTLRTEDSFGNQALIGAKGSIQTFSDLPRRAFNGMKMKINGEQNAEADNYYVEYVAGDDAQGYWKETVAEGKDTTLDNSKMPWKLVSNADGTFTFTQNDWDGRAVGDDISSPDPSFVGKKINDVFFHRNRLGVISDENVILSRSGAYFKFYAETVTTILDTDPIDVSVSHTKVSILRHAIPFNETLLLFSDQTQFMLNAGDSLTPATVSINQTTEYESSLQASPVGAGEYVYFATNREGFAGVREFFVQADTSSNVAIDATLNVSRYIKGKATALVSNTNEDMIFVLTDGVHTSPTCYVYKYLRRDGQALQMSWSKWEFPSADRILNLSVIESTAYWLIQRGTSIMLEKMQLQESPKVTSTGKMVYLDSLQAGSTAATGQSLVTVDGTNYVGYPYTMSYTFSTQYKRTQGLGGSQLTDTSGRLQMRKFSVLYEDTGHFNVETISQGVSHTYSFSGPPIGLQTLGQVNEVSGGFTFPLQCKNDRLTVKVTNSTHYPSAFQSAEWTGYYTTKSRRI
jgi:hypothetical protein